MTPELTALALAGLLQVVQMALFSVLAQMQVGPRYAASPRDEKREVTGMAGRAQRAMLNHFEGLILFALAVTWSSSRASPPASPRPPPGSISSRAPSMSRPMSST